MNDDQSLRQDLDPQSDHSSDYLPQHPHHPSHPLQPQQQPQPQPRRPRGFAATAAGSVGPTSPSTPTTNKGKREREREKERTKLRERLRRSITSRMLAGLRQYGNFPLPARADMNDVLAALAREAGWVVEADGTTYRQSPPPSQIAMGMRSVESPVSSGVRATKSLECHPPHNPSSVVRIDESLSPASLDSVVIAERDTTKNEKFSSGGSPINSVEADQLMQDLPIRPGNHGIGTTAFSTPNPYVPLYVTLATGFINNYCQLVDPEGLRQELTHMQSLSVDGVVVDCWWGIVEGWSPQKYVWSGYRGLFNILREFKFKLQVVMAFHEYGRSESGEALIPLPQWILEIGKENQDIFFTDREGRRNTECLSWGLDKERVLHGRTGVEVYFDFMRSFRTEFDDLFAEGLISAVEIGLGSSGELKYPSFSGRMGWRYPGVGEFQCYDRYLQQSLRRAAKLRGHSFWARGPDNAGEYNSRPHETGFFCERGDYDSYYGRFFLHWYAQSLIDHADNVLSLASLAFDETKIIVKVPAVYWWYKTSSHAAELTSGYYNPTNQDGYSPVFEVLKKHSVTVKFVCSGLHVSSQDNDEALADPEGLSWQVLNLAWDQGLLVAGENALSCFDRDGCMRIVEMVKPRNDPDHRHFSCFVYQQPAPLVQGAICFSELDFFIKCMHGEIAGDLVSC
ncbi:beta-amylase 8 [Prunus yedoensis var. nudiflora]|uniref:Beta-amylase n=1 Tax=Prunus yedoensis var. nudiflora TaxID=2094558 RepID=A0A314UPQ7_PRUYE|nr:beta-amylase 8 [Prunus yedoensis var. nudiflora]